MDQRTRQDRLELRRGLQALTDDELGRLMRGSAARRERWAQLLPAYRDLLTRAEVEAAFFADAARRLARTDRTTTKIRRT